MSLDILEGIEADRAAGYAQSLRSFVSDFEAEVLREAGHSVFINLETSMFFILIRDRF